MDFHGFARKELQALCKQNKIPANMTNVAMADALSSLDHVEGLGEIMEQRSNKSIEVGTPEVPKTATKTLTRGRKPAVNVLESGGAVASSMARVRTSRKVGDGDLVKDEVKGVENTPAAASCRKTGGGVASRKVEVPSVQRVYSTRRSVRLVEKQLSELCLRDTVKRARRPIKIDDELSSEITISNIKGDQVKTEVLEECFQKAVKDEVNSSQESTQAVDAVAIAAQGSSALNGGVTDETRIDEVEKVIYEDCAKAVICATGNAGTQIAMTNDASGNNKVTDDSLEEDEEKAIEVFANDVDSIDKIKILDIGMADAAAVDEMVKAKSENAVNDAVDALGNFEDGGKGVSKADEVAFEGVVKTIFVDSADIVSEICDMENSAVGNRSTAIAEDALVIEDQGEYFLPGLDSVNAEKALPANLAVVQSDVIADHGPDLLNEKKCDFDPAANQDSKFKSVREHDSEAKQKESYHSSAENVQAYSEATKIQDEYFSTFADTGFEVTSAMENTTIEEVVSEIEISEPAVTKGNFSVEATTTIPGISPHLKGQLSAKRTVTKELPLSSEDTKKENIASIHKTEESSKAPKTPYKEMSFRRLLKTFKKLTINQETEATADANNLIAKQHAVTTTHRKALQNISANSRKQ